MSPAFLSLSFSILALTIASCFADIVTLHKNHRGSVATLGSVGQVEDLHFLPPAGTTPGDAADNHLELLDIVLLASVDGKFHALNRVTGEQLWSMSSTATYTPQNNAARSVVSTLQPLVTTQHADRISDFDDDEFAQETYIIEPQSGDIFVSASPTGPLQRLPFSMSQLVDMSPFSFGDGDRRVFVGRRKTSLMVLELETGRIKAALDSECPWDPLEDFFDKDTTDYDVDLDELDGTKPPKQYPREIYIGRTDYHISIHTRPLSPSARRPPPQNLSFSTYGPNNQDLEQQASYRRTVDNTYVEPLPNGEVIAFKTHIQNDNAKENTFVWGQRFSSPIVTIFDVVKNPGRAQPFVLLQPRPRIEDVFPDLNLPGSKSPHTQNTDSAYVGLVEETGSLFAMSPDHFPLVIFGGGEDRTRKTIDPPPGSGRTSHRGPSRELRCEEGTMDRRCAVGVRPLKSDSRSRLARLLDGAPANALPLAPPPVNAGVGGREPQPESPNMHTNSSFLPWPWPGGGSQHEQPLLGGAAVMSGMSLFMGLISFVVLGFGTLWGMRRRSRKQSLVLSSPTIQSEAKPSVEDVPNGVAIPDTPTPGSDAKNPLTPASDPGQLPVVTVPEEQKGRIAVRIAEQEEGGEDESEKEGDVGATPGRRKPARRRRGKKKKGAKDTAAEGDGEEPAEGNADSEEGRRATPPLPVPSPSPSRLLLPPTPEPSSGQSLVVSETILGFGSHGTVVYEGSLQGRAVAVKRLLQDFVTLAAREVSLLQDADDHPNVIRYYYQESHANFLYIALELCPASLADIIERPDQHRDIAVSFDAKRALRQITSGLRHLHALKIVHRDIKPQNILISSAKKGAGESAGHRMLISDFGLCRKLEVDQTSFLPTAGGAMGVGTFGWRAPEILRGDVKLDETTGDDHSQSSRDSVGTATGSSSGIARPTRLTKSVDIFALGCLFFYVLTNGGHPFGDRFEREVNILKNERRLEGLDQFGEEGSEAVDLISSMLEPQADHRPDTTTTLAHPYFWDPGRRLAFLQDASDRFEIMCRDPRDPGLVALEENAINVVGPDWPSRLDKVFVENLGKFRKYDPRSVQDLLRALRNKKHHYQDLPENVKRHVGSMPDGYLQYFTRRFPRLFLHVHSVIASSSLRHESMFRSYFDVRDS